MHPREFTRKGEGREGRCLGPAAQHSRCGESELAPSLPPPPTAPPLPLPESGDVASTFGKTEMRVPYAKD